MREAAPSRAGFTIVELLIVIVVIGILAAITIVTYNGIQQRTRDTKLSSILASANKKAQVEFNLNGSYPPTSALGASSDVSLTMTADPSTETLCITASGTNYTTKNITQTGTISNGPCDGHSGGASYCPTDSYIDINGYYCEGIAGSVALKQNSAVKLDATTSPIPSGAPGAYVGRQSTRDNNSIARFTAVAGEVYCVSGWVATVDSTIQHQLDINFQGSYGQQWLGTAVAADTARNKWVKVSGCVTAPVNTTSGGLWTQNNGTNGTTADPYWYQTAIKLTKQ
jgi:prepilin-type N-terminal cleavage/methylation domain-containing protein